MRFIDLPTSESDAKFYTIHTKNVDSDKVETQNLAAEVGEKQARKTFTAIKKAGKGRVAGFLVNGAGGMIDFAYTNIKTGVNKRYHASDALLGEWSQAQGKWKNFVLSEKATGIYTTKEWNKEWTSSVVPAKNAYRKRMIAKALEVLATR